MVPKFDDARHNIYIIPEKGKNAISTFAGYKTVDENVATCGNKQVNIPLTIGNIFRILCILLCTWNNIVALEICNSIITIEYICILVFGSFWNWGRKKSFTNIIEINVTFKNITCRKKYLHMNYALNNSVIDLIGQCNNWLTLKSSLYQW